MKDFRKEVLALLALLLVVSGTRAFMAYEPVIHKSASEARTNIYGVNESNISNVLLDRAHPNRSTNRSLLNQNTSPRELGISQFTQHSFSLPESAMTKSTKQISFDDHQTARKMRELPRTLGDVPLPNDLLSKDSKPRDSESVARKLSEDRKLIYDAMPDGKTIDVTFETEEIKDALLFIEFKMSEINTLMTECINQQFEANLMASAQEVKNQCVGLTYQILFYNYKEGLVKVKDILLELLKIKLQTIKEDYQDETNFFLDILENLIDKDYSILPSLEIARKASKYYVSPRYYERLVELAMPEINAFDAIHQRLKAARNQIQAVLDQKQKEEQSFLTELKQHAEELKTVDVVQMATTTKTNDVTLQKSVYQDPNDQIYKPYAPLSPIVVNSDEESQYSNQSYDTASDYDDSAINDPNEILDEPTDAEGDLPNDADEAEVEPHSEEGGADETEVAPEDQGGSGEEPDPVVEGGEVVQPEGGNPEADQSAEQSSGTEPPAESPGGQDGRRRMRSLSQRYWTPRRSDPYTRPSYSQGYQKMNTGFGSANRIQYGNRYPSQDTQRGVYNYRPYSGSQRSPYSNGYAQMPSAPHYQFVL